MALTTPLLVLLLLAIPLFYKAGLVDNFWQPNQKASSGISKFEEQRPWHARFNARGNRKHPAATMTKLIIDSDMGIDDAGALILALSHFNVQVLAITVVFGNAILKQAVANANRIRKLCGQEQVPIYAGASGPLITQPGYQYKPNPFHGSDGLGDSPDVFPAFEELDLEAAVPGKHAALAIIDIVHKNPGCTIVCLGPLTNLALAIKLDPTLSDHLGHAILMGGNIHAVGNVAKMFTAENNFFADPEAAHIVLSELKSQITAYPWESYLVHPCSEEFIQAYANNTSNDKGRFIRGILKKYMDTRDPAEMYGLCDEMATAIAIDPSIVLESEKQHFALVELQGLHTRGQVAIDHEHSSGRKPNIQFVTKVDMGKAEKMIVESYYGSGKNRQLTSDMSNTPLTNG